MTSLRLRPHSPAVKTPLEDDDLLSEILLRLPPQPSSLPRASLVCKRWRSLASDPGFFSRFRRHHRRNPPLLGFFFKHDSRSFIRTLEGFPPGRFSLQHSDRYSDRFKSLGCRHGLVLIFNKKLNQMLVWDPVTGDQHRLAIPPAVASHAVRTAISGAVLRVGDAHFQVILTEVDNDDKQHKRALARVYSSETSLWGDLVSTPLPFEVHMGYNHIDMTDAPTLFDTSKPAVLAGNSLYWMLTGNFVGILEFDLEKQRLAVIRVPSHMIEQRLDQLWIVRVVGGGLGLLFLRGSILQFWKRKTDCDGVASWAFGKSVDLDKLLPLNSPGKSIVGFAEESNVVFLWVCGDVFMVHLESLQFKKLFKSYMPSYHPFEDVYPAGI